MSRWSTILAVDSCPRACEAYAANVPGADVLCRRVEDVIPMLPVADVVLGGFPCQPHSNAGKRLASADDRDGGPVFVAAIERVRPRMFLGENVPGIMSSEGGRYVRRLVASMESAGYVVDVRELDAVHYGVPQFRRRVWFWGIRRDLYAEGVLHSWPTRTHVWPWPAGESMFGGDLIPAVTCGQALGLAIYDAQNDTEHGFDVPCGTLQGEAQAKGGRAGHYAIRRARSASVVRRDHPSHEPCPTIGNGASGSGAVLRIIGAGSNPHFAGDARTEGDITGEPSTTIPTGDIHKTALPKVHAYRWSDAMREKHPPASPAPTVLAKGLLVELAPDVRRLTPTECARLQSMPDDFVWPPGVKKTHQYRIIGNGWASLMAKRLGEALAAADPESRTVVDLFCGGGCGAVGWHGRAWEHTGGRPRGTASVPSSSRLSAGAGPATIRRSWRSPVGPPSPRAATAAPTATPTGGSPRSRAGTSSAPATGSSPAWPVRCTPASRPSSRPRTNGSITPDKENR